MSGEEVPIRLAVESVLKRPLFVGWLRVVTDEWRGIVSIFESEEGQAYAWRDANEFPHVILRTDEISTPDAAIRAWLKNVPQSN